jgi:hypothetical protein
MLRGLKRSAGNGVPLFAAYNGAARNRLFNHSSPISAPLRQGDIRTHQMNEFAHRPSARSDLAVADQKS